jgi:hypothetical protein
MIPIICGGQPEKVFGGKNINQAWQYLHASIRMPEKYPLIITSWMLLCKADHSAVI